MLIVFSQMMLSLCTEYYQILLAQGIGLGIGFGLVFNLAVSAPTNHFDKRRGIAMGIMASSSSAGGTIYPIMIRHLIPRVGYGMDHAYSGPPRARVLCDGLAHSQLKVGFSGRMFDPVMLVD